MSCQTSRAEHITMLLDQVPWVASPELSMWVDRLDTIRQDKGRRLGNAR